MLNKKAGTIFATSLIAVLFLMWVAYAAVTGPIFGHNTTLNFDNDGNITLNWTQDATEQPHNYTIYFIYANNGTVFNSTAQNDSTTGITINGLSDGVYNFSISTNGTVANVTTANITIDKTNATSTMNGPDNNTNHSTPYVLFNFTIADNIGAPINYTVYLNGVANSTGTAANNTATTVNITGLADGHYWFVVQATDNATNKVNSTNRSLVVDTKSPNLTLTLSASSITTRQSIDVKCTPVDSLDSNMNITAVLSKPDNIGESFTKAANVTNNTVNTFTFTDTETSNVGTYTAECRVSDDAGNLKSVSSTFVVSAPIDNVGGGGGGGSATVEKEDGTVKITVTPGSPAKAAIVDEKVPVKEITITATQAGTATVVTKTVESNPVATAPAPKVFNYLDLDVQGIDKSAITSAKVKFTVTKAWVNANNVDASKISLYRNVDGQWTKLTTVMLSEDATSYQFEAETPGFSYFAIGGEEKVAAQEPQEEEQQPVQEEQPPQQQPEEKSGSGWAWIVVLALIAVAAAVYWKRYR